MTFIAQMLCNCTFLVVVMSFKMLCFPLLVSVTDSTHCRRINSIEFESNISKIMEMTCSLTLYQK